MDVPGEGKRIPLQVLHKALEANTLAVRLLVLDWRIMQAGVSRTFQLGAAAAQLPSDVLLVYDLSASHLSVLTWEGGGPGPSQGPANQSPVEVLLRCGDIDPDAVTQLPLECGRWLAGGDNVCQGGREPLPSAAPAPLPSSPARSVDTSLLELLAGGGACLLYASPSPRD